MLGDVFVFGPERCTDVGNIIGSKKDCVDGGITGWAKNGNVPLRVGKGSAFILYMYTHYNNIENIIMMVCVYTLYNIMYNRVDFVIKCGSMFVYLYFLLVSVNLVQLIYHYFMYTRDRPNAIDLDFFFFFPLFRLVCSSISDNNIIYISHISIICIIYYMQYVPPRYRIIMGLNHIILSVKICKWYVCVYICMHPS